MPAESTLHQRTLMAWPAASSMYHFQLSAARLEVAAIANAISRFEPVTMFASYADTQGLRSQLNANVSIATMPVKNLWIRDSGPVFAISSDGNIHGLDFNFNHWGGKLTLSDDVALAREILALADVPRVDAQVRAEGGGLEVDGDGTLLVTESCLINPNRNPGMNKTEVEARLKSALGVDKVIWLKGVMGADITDCHIDALARFVSPGTVVLSRPHSSRPGVWAEVYEEARHILESERDSKGRTLHMVDLPEPNVDGLKDKEDEDMVASYANYYLANGAVIMPRFGDDVADQHCARILQKLFPDREVVQVLINMLPRIGGGIHCATQQQPR
ncbi:hypothetical protein V497_00258 [Pseudogymnoascus sp. VKM F-4516 (FW-969)]|nr:hypothetical protein V497_00258 [Pseudogymnoascus sp. VKM F-4516 (FW-969)]